MLHVNSISGGYSATNVLKNISFSVDSGEMFGILGPNGSGKTTLLKMISGLLTPTSGDVFINNQQLTNYSPKELAKIVAVLPQISSETFSYTVKETVSLGRYAHQKGLFQTWSNDDETIVQEVMALTGVTHFQSTPINELSGGERQRVFLAQSLAQEPKILLLDEPTNHLDLSHQKELLDQLKEWTQARGLTVVTIFHDLNLASLYCDRLLLLDKGRVSMLGTPEEVLEPKQIEQVYKTTVEKYPHPKVPKPHMVLLPKCRDQWQVIDDRYLENDQDSIQFIAPFPLKTIASAQTGTGIGWTTKFICEPNESETNEGQVAMTLREKANVFVKEFFFDGQLSAFIVAITTKELNPIHLWIFINGELSERTLIEALCTVTEIRTEIVQKSKQKRKDIQSGVVIAATQRGKKVGSATRFSIFGKAIREAVQTMIHGAIPLNEKVRAFHYKAANDEKP